jgi:ABC-type uncharacterized transport system involved in gliding motility auxiliary subunit
MTLPRAVRNWGALGLQVVLLLVGLGLLQLAAERTNRRFDLTPAQSLSLSPVTRNVLAQITAPLTVTVFFRRGTREQHADLLERFRVANPNVHFELFDLDRFPERARAAGITQYGRAEIEYQGRRFVSLALPEAELAGGILRAVRGRARRVLFTAGHGERRPGGTPDGYGRLVSALGAENYAPEPLVLLDGPVPEDADLVVIAGPQHDFLPREIDALGTYLRGGGGVLALCEPGSLPNLSAFLDSMGLRLGSDFIVDRERRVLGTDGLAAVVELFKRGNPITEPSGRLIESGVVLPSARSVDVEREVPGVEASSIARTADSAWAVQDPDRARRGAEPSRAAGDVPGSASVMVMAEVAGRNGRSGRVVVVGDADFASDAYLDLLGNRDLALNAVAWVAGEEALAGERNQRTPEVIRPLSPLVLTEPQARTIFLATVIVQPGAVLLLGIVLIAVRRHGG